MSPTGYRVWECKSVVRDDVELPEGFDFPPRRAAIDAVTDRGIDVVSCFSGWGGSLTVSECKALPRDKFDYPATSERLAMKVDAGNLTSAIASISVRLASLEAKLRETNHDAPPGARVSDRQCASPADTGANKADGTRTESVPVRARTLAESLAYAQGMSAALVTDLQSQRDKLQARVAELEDESKQLAHERDTYISNELSALRSG
jgi:hypothetical protein